MTSTRFLICTRQVLSVLAGVVLVALAINEFAASASISDRRQGHGGVQSTPESYPLRVSLVPSEPSSSGSYPVRLSLASLASNGARDPGLKPDLLLGAAFQMPERIFDIAARLAADELAKADGESNKEIAIEASRTEQLAGTHGGLVARSGRSLSNVMNVRFDLVGQIAESEGLSIRKPLFVNGAAQGEVTLRIVRDSRIVASMADLRRAFGDTAPTDLERLPHGDGYLDFDDLRSAGIAVRYDAARDVVIMTANTGKS